MANAVYIVVTRHHEQIMFETEEQAQKEAIRLVDGYLSGDLFASDPKPVVLECRRKWRYNASDNGKIAECHAI